MTKLYATLLSFVAAPKKDEKGATVVEYALVIGLISLVLIVSWAALGTKITSMISGINFTSGGGGSTAQ